MLRATIKSLFARKLRLVLTALAVVLGVGMTAGSFILTDTALKSFDDLFGTVFAGTSVVVQAPTAFDPTGGGGGGGGAERKPIPESVLPKVEAVDGVAGADGSIGSSAWIIDPTTNKVIQNGGAPPLGGSWDPNTTTLEFEPGGSPPTGPDQVVIDASTAESHGIAVGQQIKVVTPTGSGEYAVTGLVHFGASASLGGATLALFDLPTAQKVFDREHRFDAIYVRADPGVSADDLAPRVAAVLPTGYEAITGESAAQDQKDQVSMGLGFLRTFFLIFGFVTLFVGAFIIFNMFNIVVSQRTRELALFRALGASRRQVRLSLFIESIAVGLIGSVLGFGLGILAAFGLKAVVGAFGLKLPPTSLAIQPRTIVVSLIVGIGVTVAAAWVPARRASRVSPMEALRESAAQETSIRRRVIVGGIVLALGIAAIAAALFGNAANPGPVVGLGVALTFIGVATLSPLFARGLAAVIGRPFRRSAVGRLGDENAKRSPRRTASTASALMIGLGLVAFVAVFAASLKASAIKTLDEALKADLTLSTSDGFTGFSTHLAGQLRQDPDFSAVSELRQTEAHVGTSDTFPNAVDPATFPDIADITMVNGSLSDLSQPDSVLVSRTKANSDGLAVGSTIDMTFAASGKQQLHVVGTYENNAILSDYVISIATYDANVEQPLDLNVFLKVADGVSVSDAQTKLSAMLQKDYPNVQANNQEQAKQQFLNSINQLLAFVVVLLFLSIIISGFGILATLWLSVFERVRELGLLRAVGMARRQVKRMVRVEAVIVAVLGAILGIVIGIVFAWALQQALSDLGITELSVPVGQLIVMMIVAALIGVLAAILPARRAAKLNVLEAISYE
ncbi:MAG TPA: FtsX-like permease family protein [Actinomycetota bacterium]|nr:FtsX-like permease family protein [Actinomycetota bacterium]